MFNLRAVFSADTKDIKKGSKEAQNAVKEFEKTTESAVDNVAGLFGTSMSEIEKTLNSVKGGFLTINKGLNDAAKATTLWSKAMGVLKVAIAATGIGLLVTAIASLVAYFTKSQRGADQLAKAMAVVKQVFATLTDYAIKVGEKIVNAVSVPLNFIRNLIKSEEDTAKKTSGFLGDLNDKIDRRVALTERQQALERKNIEWIVEQAELQQKIEQQREIAADKGNRTAQERLAANKKALALTAELYKKQEDMQRERLALIQEENDLSESMNKDLEAEAQAKVALLNIEKERASRSKELLSQQAELTNQAKKEREEKEKAAALATRKSLELTIPKMDMAAIQDKLPDVTIPVKLGIKDEDWAALKERVNKHVDEFTFDIESTMETITTGIAESVGEMLAGLITGDAKIEDLIGSIVSLLGMAMKQIGSALIAYGMAMDAFKKAFENPWAAIAAGVALVAAGAVLTSLVGKFSSSGSSSSAVGANAGLIAGGSTVSTVSAARMQSSQSAINVQVSGRLVGQGSTLVGVVENENKRKSLAS